jgi:hypothetical protein
MSKDWFEMKDLRRRKLDTAVWITLRSRQHFETSGKWGFAGHRDDLLLTGSVAVPVEARERAERLDWVTVSRPNGHLSCVDDGVYIPGDEHDLGDDLPRGLYLALEQDLSGDEAAEWHLHQDLVMALGLKREGDSWVCPGEGYVEVARLRRNGSEEAVSIEVRAEHLRDYLQARQMALFVSSYRRRVTCLDERPGIQWDAGGLRERTDDSRWEGRVYEIYEGGSPVGASTTVFHITRTNVDQAEDVPRLDSNSADSFKTESWTVPSGPGKRLFVVEGELWRDEWVEPAPASPRVRGDETLPVVTFITDATGTSENRVTLVKGGRWLWFRPNVVRDVLARRGGGLEWYSRDTGGIWSVAKESVVFGVNKVGLLNVYSKDIAMMPDWQQRIWAGHNIPPEGGVSEELLVSQGVGKPADSTAPEDALVAAFLDLRGQFSEFFKVDLVPQVKKIEEILARCHRFRAVDQLGLLELAKDLARVTADAFDATALNRLASTPKNEQRGSLKALELLLAKAIGQEPAHVMLGPLVGIYELRHADAHLPSSDIQPALDLAGVSSDLPFVIRGTQILANCGASLSAIAEAVRRRTS